MREGKLAGEGVILTRAASPDVALEVRATGQGSAGLVFRAKGAEDHVRFELSDSGARLLRREGGKDREIARVSEPRLAPGRRLWARVEGGGLQLAVDDVPVKIAARVEGDGAEVGLFAAGEAAFENFAAWPCRVEVPKALAALLPDVPPRADGEILVHDDFEGDGPLEGRKAGKGTWSVLRGEWSVEGGAARLKAAPGFVTIETGANDYEIAATVEFRGEPEFPAVLARVDRPRASGWITARTLWQSASPEIEVWDHPAEDGTGAWPTVLINATNITGLIRPNETHVLRMAVRGNRVSYFRDDLLVGTAPTRALRGTRAGLEMAAGGNAGCRWLDFTVRAFRQGDGR